MGVIEPAKAPDEVAPAAEEVEQEGEEQEEENTEKVQKKPAGAAVDVTADWDVAARKGGVASFDNDNDKTVCGKCGEALPSGEGVAMNVHGLPKGWTLSGRGVSTLKCGKCNTTCVQLHRNAIQLSTMEQYNPVEVRKFFEEAKSLGSKAVKQAIHFHCLCVSHFHFLCVFHFQCLCAFRFQCLCVFRFQRLFVFDFQENFLKEK